MYPIPARFHAFLQISPLLRVVQSPLNLLLDNVDKKVYTVTLVK